MSDSRYQPKLGLSLEGELEMLAQMPDWQWPRETTATVLAGLESGEAETRRLALELAASVMSDQVAGVVLRILESDPDVRARGRAAIAFGPMLEEMGAEEIFAEAEGEEGTELTPLAGAETVVSPACFRLVEKRLEALYRDGTTPKLVRRRCLEAAVRIRRPWQDGQVRAAWSTDDEEWHLTAIFCMGFLPGFDRELLEALELEAPELRLEALRAVGQRGLDEAGGTLLAVVDDPNAPREQKIAAVAALGSVDAPGRLELLDRISGGPDEELAEVAEEALEELALYEESERILSGDYDFDDDEDFDLADGEDLLR
ncbi:MAG: hypothetical protein MI919_38095 [Holophagales bacterium]|nr:hypothetical protein [Holophagales bacterium]